MEKCRADKMLVELGLAGTRSKASQMIERGEVIYKGAVLKKSSQVVESEGLEVTSEHTYVGRGAYKLLKAIEEFKIDFKGKTVADIGASTGGFTEISLLNGAKKVFALDVGHDQLDPILVKDERVQNLEGINIRECESLGELVDIVVVDLSFISLEIVFKDIDKHLKENGEGVFLIKPQFELSKSSLGKKGIVRDKEKIIEALLKNYVLLNPQAACVSPIKGKEGNIEFLFYYVKGKNNPGLELEELKELVLESE